MQVRTRAAIAALLITGAAAPAAQAAPTELRFGAPELSVTEAGTTLTVDVIRTAGDDDGGTLTVNYATANGTAQSGSDFTATNGTLTFAPGDSVETISVGILTDTVFEGEERFTVALSAPFPNGVALGTPSTTTVRIADDDDLPADLRQPVVGLTAGGSLVTFSADRPGATSSPLPVTGLGAGEALVGIDVRPATGTLYGVSRAGGQGRLYRIDTVTGAATLITSTPFALAGASKFAVDFNPVPDAVRIISDAGANLRVNATTGNLAATDTVLGYSSNDVNAGESPAVTAAAYTGSVPGAATTLLFDIDVARDALVTQDLPNTGTLNTKAPIGMDVVDASVDIPAAGDVGLAVLLGAAAGSRPTLHAIDLTARSPEPAARLIGSVGGTADPVIDLAIAPPAPTLALVLGTTAQQVATVRADRPDVLASAAQTITGLDAGETVVGIDVRPATGELTAVTSASRLLALDPVTGVTSAPRAITPVALSGTSFGVDYNPVPDRLRIVSDAEQNQRLNPDTGASGIVAPPFTDGALAYAGGDSAPAAPDVVAAAYTNSVAGSTATQLFDIDAANDRLALQNPPNNGTLVSVGTGLGIGDITGVAAYDIVASSNLGLAALQVAGQPGSVLHGINGSSSNPGRAVRVGTFPGGALVSGLAVLPGDRLALATTEASGAEPGGAITVAVTRASGDGRATVAFATADGTAKAGEDFDATSGTLVFAAGETVKTVTVPVKDDTAFEGTETLSLTLSGATGATLTGARTAALSITDDERPATEVVRVEVPGPPGPPGPPAVLPADRTAPVLRVVLPASAKARALRTGTLRLAVRCSEACSFAGRLTGTGDAKGLQTTFASTGAAGRDRVLRLRLSSTARRRLRRTPSGTLSVAVTAQDAAGNATTARDRTRIRR